MSEEQAKPSADDVADVLEELLATCRQLTFARKTAATIELPARMRDAAAILKRMGRT